MGKILRISISCLLLAALLVTLFTGCGTAKPVANDPPTVTETTGQQPPASQPAEEQPAQITPEEPDPAEAESEPEPEEPVPEEPEPAEPEPEPEPEPDPLYAKLANWDFVFSSGAGGWETNLTIKADGSFSGAFYDGDMGDTGPGYEENGTFYFCSFSGQLGAVTQRSETVYEVEVASLEYADEPDTEEIEDGTRYVYSDAYGISGAESLLVYLPGTEIASLPEGYLTWVQYLHFGTYLPDSWELDLPEDLPFCGIYNEGMDCGFFSSSREVNGTYLVNRARFPGLVNQKSEWYADGGYLCVDMDPSGLREVMNVCFRPSADLDSWDKDAVVRAALDYLFPEITVSELYTYGGYEDSAFMPALLNVNGYSTFYAAWQTGANEDTRFCRGRFLVYDGFLHAYVLSSSEYDEYLVGEAADFYLKSLALSGKPDVSSASAESEPVGCVYAYIDYGSRADELRVNEALWLGWNDTELLEAYGYTEDDLEDDYIIISGEVPEKVYKLAADCPIYEQHPEDSVLKVFLTKEQLQAECRRWDGRLFVMLYLNENDEICFLYEPYRP